MISAYRKRFAVELFYHRTNKVCHTSSANKFDSGHTTSGTLSSAHPTSANQTLLELEAVSDNCGDEDQSKTSTAGDGDKSNTAARMITNQTLLPGMITNQTLLSGMQTKNTGPGGLL